LVFHAPARIKNESELPFLIGFPAYSFMLALLFAYFAVATLIFGFFTTFGPGEVTGHDGH